MALERSVENHKLVACFGSILWMIDPVPSLFYYLPTQYWLHYFPSNVTKKSTSFQTSWVVENERHSNMLLLNMEKSELRTPEDYFQDYKMQESTKT